MGFSQKNGRVWKVLRKVALSASIVFGFVSILFSRDFDGLGKVVHESKDLGVGVGVAHADVYGCYVSIGGGGDGGSDDGASDSGSGSSECSGDDGGGDGG